MKREDINIRDPFILPYEGKYYLYGSRGSEVWEDNATGLTYTSVKTLKIGLNQKRYLRERQIFGRTDIIGRLKFMRTTARSICLRHSNRRTDAAELWY